MQKGRLREVKEARRQLHTDLSSIGRLPEEVVSGSVKKWMVKARKNLFMRRNKLDLHAKVPVESFALALGIASPVDHQNFMESSEWTPSLVGSAAWHKNISR